MALQKTIEFKGVAIPDCYIKITKFSGDGNKLDFDVAFSAGKDSDVIFRDNYSLLDYTLDSPNPITQGYSYLKSLDKFSACLDI